MGVGRPLPSMRHSRVAAGDVDGPAQTDVIGARQERRLRPVPCATSPKSSPVNKASRSACKANLSSRSPAQDAPVHHFLFGALDVEPVHQGLHDAVEPWQQTRSHPARCGWASSGAGMRQRRSGGDPAHKVACDCDGPPHIPPTWRLLRCGDTRRPRRPPGSGAHGLPRSEQNEPVRHTEDRRRQPRRDHHRVVRLLPVRLRRRPRVQHPVLPLQRPPGRHPAGLPHLRRRLRRPAARRGRVRALRGPDRAQAAAGAQPADDGRGHLRDRAAAHAREHRGRGARPADRAAAGAGVRAGRGVGRGGAARRRAR